jgi:hypothetical protein
MKAPPHFELQQRLRKWFPDSPPPPELPAGSRGTYERVFTPLITLWYLVFQRLHPDATLAAAVLDALGGGADALARPGKRPSRCLRSSSTAAYSDARQRLSVTLIQEVFKLSARAVVPSGGAGTGPRIQLLDGTLLAMLANPQLAQKYPPARNQLGPSDWCQMRCVAAFEAHHGGVLSVAQGPITTSEQTLAWEIFGQSTPGTLSVGDRNFGVFSVVQGAAHHRQDLLVRLTAKRAHKLGGSPRWASGQEQHVSWSPSRHDQRHPEAADTPVPGRLIFVRLERPGHRPIELWLFTTLHEVTVEQLVAWYGLRWRAESNFRSLKSQLELRQFTAGSVAMVRKEFYAALIAYNLVRDAMIRSATALGVPLRRISFQAVRRALLQGFLELAVPGGGAPRRLQGLRLPTRRRPRPNEPRRIRERPRIYPPLRGSRAAARLTHANLTSKS